MKNMQLIGPVALVAILAAGCATDQDNQIKLAQSGGMYSALDATAQVYSNPRAQAPVDDNPWRWVGIMLHPVGVLFDYGVNRPFYVLASSFPDVFGYTSEDALIDSRRTK